MDIDGGGGVETEVKVAATRVLVPLHHGILGWEISKCAGGFELSKFSVNQ